MSFDMTLVQMELNIAKLKKQKQEQDLQKAVNRLNSLKNGGPIEEEDSRLPDLPTDNSTSDTEMASAAGNVNGSYLAAIIRPILAAADVGLVTEDDFLPVILIPELIRKTPVHSRIPAIREFPVTTALLILETEIRNRSHRILLRHLHRNRFLLKHRMKNLQIPLQTMTLRSLIRNRTVTKATLQTVNRSFIRS